MRFIPAALITLAIADLHAGAANAQAPTCTPIQLPPGQTSTTVRGTATTDPPLTCYTLTTRGGQTASISIVHPSPKDDTSFNIAGLVDNQDKYTFKTQTKTYKIDVYLTFARQSPRPFTMQVSVR